LVFQQLYTLVGLVALHKQPCQLQLDCYLRLRAYNDQTYLRYSTTVSWHRSNALLCSNIRHYPILGTDDLGSVIHCCKDALMLSTLKWTATLFLIVGFGLVSAGFYSAILIQLCGGVLWLTASVIMRDRPLIVTNGVMTLAGVLGLVYKALI